MRYRYLDDFRRGISVFAIISYGIAVLGTPQCPPQHSDSDYTFLVMFPGCRTSNLTAGVTGHEALWPM